MKDPAVILIALICGSAVAGVLGRPVALRAAAQPESTRKLRMEIIPGSTDIQAFPYLSVVVRKDAASGSITGNCTGTLVENGWRVVTAQQCVSTNGTAAPPEELSVWIAGNWHAVSAVVVQPGYPASNTANPAVASSNLAVLMLATESSAAPAKLPFSTADPAPAAVQPLANETVWVAGWGVTQTVDQKFTTYYETLVQEDGVCAAKYSDAFCSYGKGGPVPQTATGAPVVRVSSTQDELVGVVGWSDEMYATYTIRITNSQAFLSQNIAY